MKETILNITVHPGFEKYAEQVFKPNEIDSHALSFATVIVMRVQIDRVLEKAERWRQFVDNMGA
ncbi:MAG: hypothetical protein WD992_01260 [Candidatus Levyibacteriota bacterium]